jgi:hypothetical protein
VIARSRGWREGEVVVAVVEVSEDASSLGFCGERALGRVGALVSRRAASSVFRHVGSGQSVGRRAKASVAVVVGIICCV